MSITVNYRVDEELILNLSLHLIEHDNNNNNKKIK